MKANRTFTSFSDWHFADIKRKLGITKTLPSPALKNWVEVSGEIPTERFWFIKQLRKKLDDAGSEWNEDELKFCFIGPLVQTIDFQGENFKQFLQRTLHYQAKGYKVSGQVDWMAAQGDYEPEKPYFFLHEYKKTRGTEADPLGQLLIAMLAAQQTNADGLPVYGCYVQGRHWSFVLLEGETYSESQSYDAADSDEIIIVWLILQKTRDIIAKIVDGEL